MRGGVLSPLPRRERARVRVNPDSERTVTQMSLSVKGLEPALSCCKSASGGSKYAQSGMGPLVLSTSKYEREVARSPVPSPSTGEG